MQTGRHSISIFCFYCALFFSGVSAMINQTVWQRALKVYLSGSESISSMIVVLVFMLGLGAGSFLMGQAAHRFRNPLRLFGVIEVLLFGVNILIALLLSFDISESVQTFQLTAVSLGIPLRVLYALLSTAVLLGPCLLMGSTMPLASEVAQRQLRVAESKFLTVLFFSNTLGAVAGGIASGFFLLPYLGQLQSLLISSVFNLFAGLTVIGLAVSLKQPVPADEIPEQAHVKFTQGKLRSEEVIGFFLGFLGLAYEMYLFRIAILAYQPLPYTFSTVLCFYLLLWSIGVYFARSIKRSAADVLLLTTLAVLLVPVVDMLNLFGVHNRNIFLFSAVVAIPCIGFGILFGQMVSRVTDSWGNDVGRFYGLNTLGSCLGVLFTTLIGYELHPAIVVFLIGLGYAGLLVYLKMLPRLQPVSKLVRRVSILPTMIVIAFWSLSGPALFQSEFGTPKDGKPTGQYFGREGVVTVIDGKSMIWNGLWHSTLSVEPDDQIGTNNWLQAVVPLMCYQQNNAEIETLVIGLATGITASILAESDFVTSVDGYELNPKLSQLYADFPAGTLHVAENPKINIIWQDARIGLSLNEKKYNLITQAPLYLKQAGSSILLSKQYLELVQKRLKSNGLFCIYCNSWGNLEQALIVRKTAATVFSYTKSFGKGYMIVASNDPFDFSLDKIKSKLGRENKELARQFEIYGIEKLADYLDAPRLDWESSPLMVTDNHPIVEYPNVATRLISSYLRKQQKKPKTKVQQSD